MEKGALFTLGQCMAIAREEEKNPQGQMSYSLGFPELDALLGGLFPGEVLTLASRPGMGKSKLALQWSLYLSEQHTVVYNALDTTPVQVGRRCLSIATGIAEQKILLNTLTAEEKITREEVEERLVAHNLWTVNQSFEIETFLDKLKERMGNNPVEVLVIDYIQLMYASARFRQRHEELEHIVKQLKRFAVEEKLLVVLTSQLGRTVDYRGGDKIPMLSDLRESGALEEISDKVLFLYRPAYYGIYQDQSGKDLSKHVEVMVAKNKTGKQGVAVLETDSHCTKFYEPFRSSESIDFDENRMGDLF